MARASALLINDVYLQEPDDHANANRHSRPTSVNGPPSIFSNDIFLGDNSGESLAFARDVKISGWTSVGDQLGGAYIGKCALSLNLCAALIVSTLSIRLCDQDEGSASSLSYILPVCPLP